MSIVSSETLQAVSSLALTAMSLVVAVVAAIFSYRQNVGWKPIIFAGSSGLEGRGGSTRHRLIFAIEFWNRQKYPVVVQSLEAKASGVTLLDQEKIGEGVFPFVRQNTLVNVESQVVNPHERAAFKVRVECEDQSLDAMRPLFHIAIQYFDPYRNRVATCRAEYKFFYPQLGWNKTPVEIAAAKDAYRELRP